VQVHRTREYNTINHHIKHHVSTCIRYHCIYTIHSSLELARTVNIHRTYMVLANPIHHAYTKYDGSDPPYSHKSNSKLRVVKLEQNRPKQHIAHWGRYTGRYTGLIMYKVTDKELRFQTAHVRRKMRMKASRQIYIPYAHVHTAPKKTHILPQKQPPP